MKPFKNLIFLFTLFGLTVSQLNSAEDLIVQADGIAGPTAADPGETVTFDITVENISGDTDVTVDFDVQVTIDGTTASGTTTFPAATTNIPQGGTAVVQVSVDLPNVAKNTFDVTAFADSADDIAEDDENNNTETEVAFISISEPPQIEITSPADNATVIPGTTITITTSVLDTDGVIAQVEFFVNNATIGTVTTFPFQLDFTVPSPGTLEISTTATDDSGVTADSDLVTLNSSVGFAPTVSIISPTSGESFIPGFNLDIIAEAVDNFGNVGQAIPIPLDVGPVESLLPTGFMRPLSDLESTISVGESVELKVELNAGLLDISQVNYYANGVFIGTQDTDTPVESIGQVMSSFSVLPGSRIFPEPTPCRRVPSRSIQTDSLSITGLLLIPFL